MKCKRCGRTGHPEDKCYQKAPCGMCNEFGHATARCYYDPRNAKWRPPNWMPKTCSICHNNGHMEHSCPNREKYSQARALTVVTKNAKAENNFDFVFSTFGLMNGIDVDEKELEIEKEKERANKNGEKVNVLLTAMDVEGEVELPKDLWIADSGASHHVVNSLEMLTNRRKPTDRDKVIVGKKQVLSVTMFGELVVEYMSKENKKVKMRMTNVGYIPGFCANLFSVTKALMIGSKLGNEDLAITLSTGGRTLVFDELLHSDHGYVAGKTLKKLGPSYLGSVLGSKKSKVPLELVHRQLCHPSMRYTRNTALKIFGEKGIEDMNAMCFECGMAKIKKRAVCKHAVGKSTVPGERVYVDISSVSAKSFGGSNFWVLLVDECTSKKWAGFIRTKDLISRCIYNIIRSEEKLLGNLRYIRCDNGGENLNLLGEFGRDLAARIKLEYTAPYTPQQNGVVERSFAFMYGMLRATVNGLKFKIDGDKTAFWAEAARHVTMMDGMVVRDNKFCPDELFYDGKTPKFWGYLRTFGEMAIVKFGPKIKSKLRNRGQEMVFLGVETRHPSQTFRFLNWETKRIVHSRDVLWMNLMIGEFVELKKGGQEKIYIERIFDENLNEKRNIDELEIENGEIEEVLDGIGENNGYVRHGGHVRENNQAVPDENVQVFNGTDENEIDHFQAIDLRSISTAEDGAQNDELMSLESENWRQQRGLVGDNERRITRSQTVKETRGKKYHVGPFGLSTLCNNKGEIVTSPVIFGEAWDNKDEENKHKWRAAIEKEVKDITERKVWNIVPYNGQRYIPLKWVFNIKQDGRYRARLVALGYRQVQGIDYEEMHAPVISDVGFRMIVNISIQNDWKLVKLDVEAAFLLGKLNEETASPFNHIFP